jgi:hypothetical protein
MAGPKHFWRSESGSTFESMALALSVTAVMFVAGADLLSYASKRDGLLARVFNGRGAEIAQMTRESLPKTRGDVDYSATGSIIGLRRVPTLDPCTGATKP